MTVNSSVRVPESGFAFARRESHQGAKVQSVIDAAEGMTLFDKAAIEADIERLIHTKVDVMSSTKYDLWIAGEDGKLFVPGIVTQHLPKQTGRRRIAPAPDLLQNRLPTGPTAPVPGKVPIFSAGASPKFVMIGTARV